jgi:23S rRNA (guanosine2251-2'-O)-methyltransferase
MKMPKKQISSGDIIYGVHPLIECLKAGRRKIQALYTTKPYPKGWERIKPHLPKRIPNIQYVNREALTRLCGTPDHMGVVAYVQPFVYATKGLNPENKPRVLLLDGVQDVGNLGAILRSAYCTNVDAVILCKKGGCLITPGVLKGAAGLAEHLSIYVVPSLPHAVRELKKMGYSLYMTVADGGENAMEVAFEKPYCMVIGSEYAGISPQIREQGVKVTLPQRDTSSYNASVAAGIFLFISGFGDK